MLLSLPADRTTWAKAALVTFPHAGPGDASEQEGGRWQDLLRNEVQQGQGSSVLAVRLHDDGLKVEEIETPSPDPGEVLVRVRAAAITRDELEWPVDRLPAIPSYELSGIVVGSGDEYMRSRLSIATAWLPSTPSSQPICLHRSPCG